METTNFPTAKNEKIRNINQDFVNKKVRILGTVIPTKENNVIYLDDGTAKIKVQVNETVNNLHQLVRVAGRVILNRNQETEIKADYIQNMGNLNKILYSKVQDIKQKLKL
ncbi:MAG: hypothetical protein EAX96_02715 [Candidatus Lokiarchaeota archaeon]|nr:hypothetical protein [Candidatus Lokiarchaeota archaeon]